MFIPDLVLSPAYGRDYKNLAELKADFYAGKDFILHSTINAGTYCNQPDILNHIESLDELYTMVEVRYGNMQKVGAISILKK